MDERSDSGDIPGNCLTAGIRQSERLIRSGNVSKVYLAHDASRHIAEKISSLCKERDIVPDTSYSMAALGKLCGIEVGCAVCVEK